MKRLLFTLSMSVILLNAVHAHAQSRQMTAKEMHAICVDYTNNKEHCDKYNDVFLEKERNPRKTVDDYTEEELQQLQYTTEQGLTELLPEHPEYHCDHDGWDSRYGEGVVC